MSRYTEKTKISYNEYLQLTGLLTIARHHNRALQDIEAAACAITGEESNSGGHTGDYIWGQWPSENVDNLLKKLDISVEPRPEPAEKPA